MLTLVADAEREKVELLRIVDANQNLRLVRHFHDIIDHDFFECDLQVTDSLIFNQELFGVLLQLVISLGKVVIDGFNLISQRSEALDKLNGIRFLRVLRKSLSESLLRRCRLRP